MQINRAHEDSGLLRSDDSNDSANWFGSLIEDASQVNSQCNTPLQQTGLHHHYHHIDEGGRAAHLPYSSLPALPFGTPAHSSIVVYRSPHHRDITQVMSVPNLPQSHSQSTQWQDPPSDPAALQHANLLTQSTDLATLHQQITELSLRASRVTGVDLQSVLWTVGVRNLLAKRSQDEASTLRDVHIVLKNLEVLVSAEGLENGSMERQLENGIGGSSSAGTSSSSAGTTKSPMKEPGKQPPKSPISAHSTFSGDQLLN